jgi:glycosyl hydrolase family 114
MQSECAKSGIGIGLKNALEILPSVSSIVQFAVNEQCAQFNECDGYNSFLASKAVFHIEYVDSIDGSSQRRKRNPSPFKQRRDTLAQLCDPSNANGSKMSTVIKTTDLGGIVQYCDGTVATTQTSS